MEQNLSLEQTLAQLNQGQKRQEKLRLIQIALIGFVAILFVVVLILVANVAAKATETLEHVEGSLVSAADNINEIALELQEVDFASLETTIESFAVSGSNAVTAIEEGMEGLDAVLSGAEEALSKLNGIDIEALNAGIEQLNKVLKPLSDFFGVFQR